MLIALIGAIALLVILIGLAWLSTSEVVPWVDRMERVNLGNNVREWLAPVEVCQQVMADYQQAITFTRKALRQGWIPYGRVLDEYATGNYLREQRQRLEKRLRRDRLRLIDILDAQHELRVRHFSDDGLACILLDYQTARRLRIYEYWTRRLIQTLTLDDTIYVYQMVYDHESRRWKIAEFIQELPARIALMALHHPLSELLPHISAAGRDH